MKLERRIQYNISKQNAHANRGLAGMRNVTPGENIDDLISYALVHFDSMGRTAFLAELDRCREIREKEINELVTKCEAEAAADIEDLSYEVNEG